MNRPVARFLLPLLAFTIAACEQDTTAPEGDPSTVTVRAYVDANGSGVFDAGDVAVSGARIVLAKAGNAQDTISATTGTDGVASFENVGAGTYTATITGNVPAGAVLATASELTVLAPVAGGNVTTEFRYVFNPGSVTGRLYRDNNGNGVFDAGDLPASGITVRVFSGTDTTATAVASATTGVNGEYTFSGLRPGVYTILYTPFPTIQIVGGNAQQVTVTAEQAATANTRFTGSLIVTIAEARSNSPLDSALVAVEGTVVARTGTFNARSIYIQDNTGGILVFGVDTAAIRPQVGDIVRVVGRVIAFNQELEIISPTVTRIGTTTPPAPRNVFASQLNAFQFQGELVRVNALTVDSVQGGTSAGYNVFTRDGSGTRMVVRIANTGIGIPRTFWTVGGTYDISGIAARFNATAQLLPRSTADVVAVTAPQTIASARTNSPADSVTVTVEGRVTAGLGTYNARSMYIQDATGGILVFGVDTANVRPQPGDLVRVTGRVAAFNQELEIVNPVVTRLASGTVPAPRVVTAAEINAFNFQGELATAPLVTVVSVGTGNAYNVTVRDQAGTTFVVRIANTGIGIPSSFWVVGRQYDVTGILLRFNATAQLQPRSAADVVAR